MAPQVLPHTSNALLPAHAPQLLGRRGLCAQCNSKSISPKHRSPTLQKTSPLWFGMQVALQTHSSHTHKLRTNIRVFNVNKPALYDEFADFSVQEVEQHTRLEPFSFEEEFRTMLSLDGGTAIDSAAFQSTKIRLFRIATINGADHLQALNLVILPRSTYNLPIFCADFFSAGNKHIIVLDLNPLYDVEKRKPYKAKYYSKLMPLVNKYKKLLPWGEKFTSESLQFFSPLLIWTKLDSRNDVQKTVYPAFKDYLKAWLKLMDKAEPATDPTEFAENQDAQHRYLLWRATKDPGRPVLSRLLGEERCESYISEFLFNGLRNLGSKDFLDFFPEYRCADGSISRQRSMKGKACSIRPWDEDGNLIFK